jgi:hypothetical protein
VYLHECKNITEHASRGALSGELTGNRIETKMDEFLGGLLSMIAEVLFEVFLQILMEFLTALLLRGTRSVFSAFVRLNLPISVIGSAILGLVAGVLSLYVFPHTLFHPSRIHGISLLISPLLTGLFMWWVGKSLKMQGKRPVQIESFACGFVFALGMALIRYLHIS